MLKLHIDTALEHFPLIFLYKANCLALSDRDPIIMGGQYYVCSTKYDMDGDYVVETRHSRVTKAFHNSFTSRERKKCFFNILKLRVHGK